MDTFTNADLRDHLHGSGPEPGLDTSLPVPLRTIADICKARDQALYLYARDVEKAWADYCNALESANEHALFAAPTARGHHFAALEYGEIVRENADPSERAEIHRRRLDAAVWRHLLEASDLGALMDARAREEFRASLDNPAPVTVDNCASTLRALLQSGEDMQRRGLVDIFTSLNWRDYKSNDCFSIGKRIVVEHAVRTTYGGGFSFSYRERPNRREALIDLERTIDLLEGRPAKTGEQSMVRRIEARGMDDGVYEDDVFKLRWFKKGTLHVYIKSARIRAKLNHMIAEHFGAQLGDDSGRPNAHDPHFRGTPRKRSTGIDKVDRNAYYTPPNVARLLVDQAGIADFEDPRVLEPSCGHGALMAAAFDAGCRIMHGVENHVRSANAAMDMMTAMYKEAGARLESFGDRYLNVHRCSFDVWEADRGSEGYTHVLMNPPFDHQLRHVVKAFGHLAKGTDYRAPGCLVAIMAASVMTNQGHDHSVFRDWFEAKNGIVKQLPSGSFRPSGTDVDTILVKVPAEVE